MTLAAARAELAGEITAAGIPAFPNVPERAFPPAVLVLPDDPYVSPDQVTGCGSWRVRWRVAVLGGKGTNQVRADELDGHIETVLAVLDELALELVTVAEPVEVELNGAAYLGAVIVVETIQEIGE